MGFLGLTKDTKGLFNLKVKCLIWLEELEKKKKEREETIMRKEGGWERQRENASKSIRFLNTFVIWLTIAKDQLYT